MATFNEKMPKTRTGIHFGLTTGGEESMTGPTGMFIFTLTDAQTGEILQHFEQKNLITLDAGILAATLFKDSALRNGVNMLTIGTGATGNILSPNAPDNRQRLLNNEVARKAFSTTTFRNNAGVAVAYPTNIVDFTTTFVEADAQGAALNEMGMISAISTTVPHPIAPPPVFPAYDTTVDLAAKDILVNYLTFPVISKGPATILTVTWRLTF
jgi:hypothetical protein